MTITRKENISVELPSGEKENIEFPTPRSLFLMTKTGSFERVQVKIFHHVPLPFAHIWKHSCFSLCYSDFFRLQEQRSLTLGLEVPSGTKDYSCRKCSMNITCLIIFKNNIFIFISQLLLRTFNVPGDDRRCWSTQVN